MSDDRARRTPTGSLGKYRDIVIAVAFFLLFDLGVLVLNFYTSFQISEDARAINLAGRQRMLSQRSTKAFYAVQERMGAGQSFDADLLELNQSVRLFDDTLRGFRQGGQVTGGDGKPVQLQRVTHPQAQQVLDEARALWEPVTAHVAGLSSARAGTDDVAPAVAYMRDNNVKLLGLMNQLTTTLESEAAQRAAYLRLVQTVGIVLALLNFVFILFKFIRRLRTSDAAVEAANEENREILSSVREGLFLITPDLRLGNQIASSVSNLFGRQIRAGEQFLKVLQPIVSDKTLEDARNYIGLLFSPHVKEGLVQSINPLVEVTADVKGANGTPQRRHLSFHFNRVLEDSGQTTVRHLLVTVQDVSERIQLEHKLDEERRRAEKEFSMFLNAIEAEPTTLRMFIERSEALLLEVNDLLRSTADAQTPAQVSKAIDGVFRRVHAFKGEAGALGLEVLAQIAHQFETSLQTIKEQPDSGPEALLALPLPLEDLLSKIGALKKLSRMDRMSKLAEERPSAAVMAAQLQGLIEQVASDTGKQVRCEIELDHVAELRQDQLSLLGETATQLVRNAVAHGIELPAHREHQGKNPVGCVQVLLALDAIGNAELTVRDDGAGLSLMRVKERLLALGWYTPEELAEMTDRQMMAHIFRPGFSTASGATLHAGRGVGLDVVQDNVERLGGQLTVSTTPGQHTTFRIRFAL